jgi:hypothetical protein
MTFGPSDQILDGLKSIDCSAFQLHRIQVHSGCKLILRVMFVGLIILDGKIIRRRCAIIIGCGVIENYMMMLSVDQPIMC